MENITFENIAGYECQKNEARKIANFFKNFEEFIKNGAKLQKGVLLYGKHGNGKTLMAKAIANESKVKLFSFDNYSNVDDDSISIGLKKLFKEAKTHAPSIVLIDEIDRIVFSDNGYMSCESDSQRNNLRTILGEIDNIGDDSVLVIATSNSDIDCLPPALVRNGRLEKHILVSFPDKEDRIEILKYYLSKSDVFKNISAEDIATYTSSFTCSSIATLVNDVLIDCISKHAFAEFKDFVEPITNIKSKGIKRKSPKNNDHILYHEIGHFIANYVLNGEVGMIDVVPRGSSDGRFSVLDFSNPSNDKKSPDTYTASKNNCIISISGLVATEVFLKEPYFGASLDLKMIYNIFTNLCLNGMFGNELLAKCACAATQGSYSRTPVKFEIEDEYKKFLDEIKDESTKIINDNKPLIEKIFNQLKEKSILTHDEILAIINEK